MAVPTNTYTRYTAATNVREDLADFIARQDPETTPIISSAGKAKATQTLHEWNRDALRAPMPTTRPLTATTHRHRQRLPNRVGNYCQIFQDTIFVSGRAEVVDKAGMKSAMAYNKAKSYKELMRDMEKMVVSNNVAVLGSGCCSQGYRSWPADLHQRESRRGGSTVAHASRVWRPWLPLQAPHALSARPSTTPQCRPRTSARARCPKRLCICPRAQGPGLDFHRHCVQSLRGEGHQPGVRSSAALMCVSDFGAMTHVPHYMMAGSTLVYGLDLSEIKMAIRPFFSQSWGLRRQRERTGHCGRHAAS